MSSNNKPAKFNIPTEELNISKVLSTNGLSEESYFGKENPLQYALDSHVSKLMELLNDRVLKHETIKKELEKFGKDVAAVLNFDQLHICLSDNYYDENAFSICLNCQERVRSVDPKTKIVSINEQFLKSLQDMVETKNGYRFKTSRNKIGLVAISIGFFRGTKWSVREISAIIAHELGHCFEQCVYDRIDSTLLCFAKTAALEGFTLSDDFLDPNFNVVETDEGDEIGIVHNKKGNITSEKLELMNNTFIEGAKKSKEMEVFVDYMSRRQRSGSKTGLTVMDVVRSISGYAKTVLRFRSSISNKEIKNASETPLVVLLLANKRKTSYMEKVIKDLDETLFRRIDMFYRSRSVKKSRLSLFPINFLHGVVKFISNITLGTLKSTAYAVTFQHARERHINREMYTKKFEQFADTFASSYGYGMELASGLKKFGGYSVFGRKATGVNWMYNLPILNLILYWNDYMNVYKRVLYGDEHGNTDERLNMVYIHLQQELANAPQGAKQEIIDSMEEIKNLHKELITGKGVGPISYRIMNRLIIKNKFGKEVGGYEDVDLYKSQVLEEYAKIIKEKK